jgi:hypothetical protein
MNIKHLAISIFCVSSISACVLQSAETPYREIVRVPYTFQVKSFTDNRMEEQVEVLSTHSAYPFKKEQLAQILVHSMNNSLFASTPAFLDIKLKNYSTIREKKRYFISLLMDIKAKNTTNATLATGTFGCIAEKNESFELGNIIKSSATKNHVTITNRDNKAWQSIMKTCLEDIAYEFNSQIGSN